MPLQNKFKIKRERAEENRPFATLLLCQVYKVHEIRYLETDPGDVQSVISSAYTSYFPDKKFGIFVMWFCYMVVVQIISILVPAFQQHTSLADI